MSWDQVAQRYGTDKSSCFHGAKSGDPLANQGAWDFFKENGYSE